MTRTTRPLIGINMHIASETRSKHGHEVLRPECSYLESAYTNTLTEAGAECVLLPPAGESAPSILGALDGLVMIGGDDYDPYLQGFRRTSWNLRTIPTRQELFDRALIEAARKRRLPLLAIGAGMQLLNVVCGGTLSFEIGEDFPNAHKHVEPCDAMIRHAIVIADDRESCMKESFFSKQQIRYEQHAERFITSQHHQCVDDVAHGFFATAHSADGIVEAIESTDRDWLAVGVQFHPESAMADEIERKVFETWTNRVHYGVQNSGMEKVPC